LLWCYFYAIVAELSPGAFTGLGSSSKTLSVAELTYFSFNLVMTVALTNVLPVSRTAQTLVLLQEFSSVFYMAFVIARLVGMYSAPAAVSNNANDTGGTMSKRDP
jgi:hypothetical protein